MLPLLDISQTLRKSSVTCYRRQFRVINFVACECLFYTNQNILKNVTFVLFWSLLKSCNWKYLDVHDCILKIITHIFWEKYWIPVLLNIRKYFVSIICFLLQHKGHSTAIYNRPKSSLLHDKKAVQMNPSRRAPNRQAS